MISGLPEGAKDVALISFPTDVGDKGYDPAAYLIAVITAAGTLQVYYADVPDESHWSPVPNLTIPGYFTQCVRLELWGREDLLLYNDASGEYAIYHLGPISALPWAPGLRAELRAERIFLTNGGDQIPNLARKLLFEAAGPYLGICDTSDGMTTIYAMDQSSPNAPDL